jgi:hypothetical protein
MKKKKIDIEAEKKELRRELDIILSNHINDCLEGGLSEREVLAWIVPQFLLIAVVGLVTIEMPKEDVLKMVEFMYDEEVSYL